MLLLAKTVFTFDLTHAVRWWHHSWTAHAWWHGLASPTQ